LPPGSAFTAILRRRTRISISPDFAAIFADTPILFSDASYHFICRRRFLFLHFSYAIIFDAAMSFLSGAAERHQAFASRPPDASRH